MPLTRPRARLALVLAIMTVPLLLHAIPASASPGTTSSTTSATSTNAAPQSSTTASAPTTTTTASTTSTITSATTSTTDSALTTTTSAPAAPTSVQPQKNSSSPTSGSTLHVGAKAGAHAASDPADTIADYSFSPGTITVNVGDTVTWTNQGKQPHTATASDGSFNTGTLHSGQSASHTFTKAGTFAYICSIHPFMHGTVVVQGSTSGGGSGSGSGNGTGSSTPTGSTSGSGSTGGTGTSTGTPTTGSSATTLSSTANTGLPNTGMNLLGLLGAAVALIAGGVLLRRQLGF